MTERLRQIGEWLVEDGYDRDADPVRSIRDAADEIDRLTRDLAACRDCLKMTGTEEEGRLRREVERLTTEVRDLSAMFDARPPEGEVSVPGDYHWPPAEGG